MSETPEGTATNGRQSPGGRGRQGRTGRGGRGGRNGRGGRGPHSTTTKKFLGRCEALHGHVFDCLGTSRVAAESYTRVTEEIAGYAGQNYPPNGALVKKAFLELAKSTLVEAAYPAQATANTPEAQYIFSREKDMWSMKFKAYHDQNTKLEANLQATYPLVMVQCSKALKVKLAAFDNHAQTTESDQDVIELFKIIKATLFNHEAQQYGPHSLHLAKMRFYTLVSIRRQAF